MSVQPLMGFDVNMKENLESYFQLDYSNVSKNSVNPLPVKHKNPLAFGMFHSLIVPHCLILQLVIEIDSSI